MPLEYYTGFHAYTYTPQPCLSDECMSSGGATVPVVSFWRCPACANANKLRSMVNTLEECDRMRGDVATRFKQRVADVVVPKWTVEIMTRFKKAGGKVAPVRA